METSRHVETKLRTDDMQPLSSPPIKITAHSHFPVLQTTSQMHQEKAKNQEILDRLKVTGTFQQTTSATLRLEISTF